MTPAMRDQLAQFVRMDAAIQEREAYEARKRYFAPSAQLSAWKAMRDAFRDGGDVVIREVTS